MCLCVGSLVSPIVLMPRSPPTRSVVPNSGSSQSLLLSPLSPLFRPFLSLSSVLLSVYFLLAAEQRIWTQSWASSRGQVCAFMAAPSSSGGGGCGRDFVATLSDFVSLNEAGHALQCLGLVRLYAQNILKASPSPAALDPISSLLPPSSHCPTHSLYNTHFILKASASVFGRFL